MNKLPELPESSFSKSFRGYAVNQVDFFIQQVQEITSRANQQINFLTEKTLSLEKEIVRLQEAENALIRALNLSEEAKENMHLKVEEEKKQIIQAAESKANELLQNAQSEVDKLYLVFEQEKNQQKDQLKQELAEQERLLSQLKEAQNLIAAQLLEISKATIHKIGEWDKRDEGIGKREEGRGKREEGIGKREEGRGKREEVKVKREEGSGKRRGRPAGVRKSNKKVFKPQGKKALEPVKKSPGRPKKVIDTSPAEDGLPTLGKVLEAYAKSNQPKGKIADMN